MCHFEQPLASAKAGGGNLALLSISSGLVPSLRSPPQLAALIVIPTLAKAGGGILLKILRCARNDIEIPRSLRGDFYLMVITKAVQQHKDFSLRSNF